MASEQQRTQETGWFYTGACMGYGWVAGFICAWAIWGPR